MESLIILSLILLIHKAAADKKKLNQIKIKNKIANYYSEIKQALKILKFRESFTTESINALNNFTRTKIIQK